VKLPEATEGNGELTYSLSPDVPRLRFYPPTRTLSGAPRTAGRYAMTYRVTDADDDTAVLRFTITVQPDTAPSFGAQTVADQAYTVGQTISELMLPRGEQRRRAADIQFGAGHSRSTIRRRNAYTDGYADHRWRIPG